MQKRFAPARRCVVGRAAIPEKSGIVSERLLHKGPAMDLIYLLAIFGFFIATLALVPLIDRLRRKQ